MPSNPALYRFIDFIGGNILDASNVTLLQTELERLGSQGLGQHYLQGMLLNGVFNITGTSIVFTKSNPSFDVFVFVNGQFEDLGSTVTINGTQPTSGSSNPLYLNWSWDIVTSSSDATFLDGITGEPTIEAGQLSMSVSWTDTSGVALNPSIQFAKNTSPIILANFNMSVPSVVTVTYINGVQPYSWGNPTQAGFVRLTDNSGLAPGNTDSRLSDARDPLPGSVFNSSVAPLISSGFNSTTLPAWTAGTIYTVGTQIVDSNGNVETVVNVSGTGTSGALAPTWNLSLGGQTVDNPGSNQVVWINGGPASTVKYDPATSSQGGIFTDSIIYTTLKEKLTTFLDSVNTNIENVLIALTNHIGKPLGTSNTHPFPTAFQVGAAPASHVGQPLGLATSHPATVNSDTAGFVVNEVTGTVSGDAYALYDDTSALKAALTHSGDVFSLLSNASNAQGGNGGGGGGTAVNKGTLGFMSLIAAVLAEHVNYTAAGVNVRNNNPHGLVSSDIGAASESYVNTQIQDIISDVTAYTDSKTNISVREVETVGPPLTIGVTVPGGMIQWEKTTGLIDYVIFNIGGGFEIAFGFGSYQDGMQVALPEVSGWSSSNFVGQASIAWSEIRTHDNQDFSARYFLNNTTRIITAQAASSSGVGPQIASVVTCAWRFITAPPIIISSFDATVNTFNSGHVGDTVEITGRNFGSTRGSSTVQFNGTPVVTYSGWSSTSLVVVIPAGATTGVITVTVPPNAPVTSPFVFSIS